jgi:hypothetical protein
MNRWRGQRAGRRACTTGEILDLYDMRSKWVECAGIGFPESTTAQSMGNRVPQSNDGQNWTVVGSRNPIPHAPGPF